MRFLCRLIFLTSLASARVPLPPRQHEAHRDIDDDTPKPFSNDDEGNSEIANTASASTITTCNGLAELCSRKYSNVSMVGAHNSPFVVRNNLASNQDYPVTQQLDDGIRFLQAQIQYPSSANGTEPHFCHTSCALLDAGPITGWLTEVRQWLDAHPGDFVTILLGNGNYSDPSKYVPYIQSTGIVQYAFVPPAPAVTNGADVTGSVSMDDWPTFGEMLSDNKRVLMMLDYKANQTAYPWLIDEFAYLWETPFDPTVASIPVNETLPCNVQRPPGLDSSTAQRTLFLMNHNVNLAVSVLGSTINVPAMALLNETNAATGINSLGAAADVCTETWGRPPLVLNVDYYNRGTPPGSVFEVAARLNGVTYNNTCCGRTLAPVSESSALKNSSMVSLLLAVMMTALWLL